MGNFRVSRRQHILEIKLFVLKSSMFEIFCSNTRELQYKNFKESRYFVYVSKEQNLALQNQMYVIMHLKIFSLRRKTWNCKFLDGFYPSFLNLQNFKCLVPETYSKTKLETLFFFLQKGSQLIFDSTMPLFLTLPGQGT